jgi:hypothetical protein
MRHSRSRPAAALLALALVAGAAACGDDDETATDEGGASDTAADSPYTTDLSEDCPDPFVVQKDWLAQVEQAAFYQLIGPGGEMSENRYTGPLGATGIDLEIIDGGQGMGEGQQTIQTLTAGNLKFNEDVDMAFVGTDNLATHSADYPAVGVVSLLDKSPQILFWDPETYPDGFGSIDDLVDFADTGNKIYVYSITDTYGRYLVDQGVPEDAFLEGYQGDGENFVTHGGEWINQGYSSNEIYDFEHGREWEKPLDYVYVSDLGYDYYASVPSVSKDRLDELSPCLEKLVPLIQQAQIDYMEDPGPIDQLIAEYNDQDYGASFWKTPVELNEAAHQVFEDDELVSNGSNDTLGDFDLDRVQTTIDNLRPNFDDRADSDVTPESIVSNDFVDESIGLPS